MRSRIPLLVALALTGCGSESDKPSGPEPSIVDGAATLAFADSALQVAVDEAVASTSGALVALNANGRGITDLGGIEQLTQLEALDLAHNAIRDLSPLAGLRQLRLLDLGNNQIEEVSPLGALEQLQVLILAHNAVQDLAAIVGQSAQCGVDRQPAERGGGRSPDCRVARPRGDGGLWHAG